MTGSGHVWTAATGLGIFLAFEAWNGIESFAVRVGAMDLSDALVEPAYFDLHGVQLRNNRLTGEARVAR